MKVEVILGTIRNNEKTYKVGETLDLSEKEALSVIQAGAAKEYVEEVVEVKREKEVKEEPKKVEAEEVSETEEELKPSVDWTRKELDDYGRSVGIKNPEIFKSKNKLLKEIEVKKND
jgi:hypothetical protein